jgi:hypothetical protein
MRSMVVLLVVLAISGCSRDQAVRKPAPQAVAAWWRHLRELNRPNPDATLSRERIREQLAKLRALGTGY